MNKKMGAIFSSHMARVCDLLATYVERKEKKAMIKYAEDFRAFAKLFRGGKHGKKINK